MTILAWAKKYWQILVGALIALASFVTYYLKSKNIKKVLEKANESHKKETEINNTARKDLVDGLESIRKNSSKEILEKEEEISKKEKDLQKEKQKFVDEQKKSKDLAENIANVIGADFVETKD
tara:strand:+ start:359 stop:727 length:369 start_codon:yes stop_codon:yes gene_type:complete